MQKITPCLWFDNQAEEAANYYVSIFSGFEGSDSVGKNKVGRISRYDEAGAAASGRPKGSVMTAKFTLNGQEFVALNGGPIFKFTEAISLMVNCESQKEVDYFWEKLSVGGEEGPCGWLKDKFGLSWQVVPTVLGRLLSGPDPVKSQRAMSAMLQMKKLDIQALQKAYEGR